MDEQQTEMEDEGSMAKEKHVVIDQTEDNFEETTSLLGSQDHGDGDGEFKTETFSESEEEMSQEEVKIIRPRLKVEEFATLHDSGAVDLSFPENLEYEKSPECYPRSYYTLVGKERLLLLFAENFRQQYLIKYPDKRPLVLAVQNECDIQKMVCTTIRPTSFLYESLITNVEGCANFVADFIKYESLEVLYALPPKLVSPATLLKYRHGNSFEMATLLCSILIGAGFPAMVVSGSARLSTVKNDQRDVVYPLPSDHIDVDNDDEDDVKLIVSPKYTLKPKPDLKSYLSENLEQSRREKEARENRAREEAARIKREALEFATLFNDPYRLSHAWVMIVNNAPWSTKPRVKLFDEDGEEIEVPPSVIFLEPSTGVQHEVTTKAYIHIESVWNNLNYYVNLQTCPISEMNWDLRVTSDWEHLLAGEPPEMRLIEETSDENLAEEMNKITVEKHLDIGQSWVRKLEISEMEFDERFPGNHKAIYYKNVLHERFSSHKQPDGKIEQVTLFSDKKYKVRAMRWEFYDNRSDLMTKVRFDYPTGQIEESFRRGRPDSLRHLIFNTDEKKQTIMHFYSTPRVDALRYCEIDDKKVVLSFEKIPGKCFYKEFKTKFGRVLWEITEKFHRDPSKDAYQDIAMRQFLLTSNKILLKFHYLRGALTAKTREFTKPPKPDYGQEIIFDPELTTGYQFGSNAPEPTELELYLLLLDQLNAEKIVKKDFFKIAKELDTILALRKNERGHTTLQFKCSDPLRNAEARKLRLEEDAMANAIKEERHANPPDFLAPYLVPYSGRTLTHKESLTAFKACLNELKTRFVSLLNELQRRYEDLTAEALSLKKFLNKFQNKFDDFDYERLLKESKDLELNKRMVQKRLTITHEEAQKKYDLVKQSLLKDKRLNLKFLKEH